MEKLEYKVVISAPAKKVWETMLQKETYEQWVANAWPGSSFDGKWKTGERMRFVGSDGSGTLAEFIEVKPYERVLARHIAVLNPGGAEDRTSEIAKGWVVTTEEYRLAESQGKTTLTVLIETTPEWRKMFDDSWPTALQDLKTIAERQMQTA
jgi:uncharacterized protein YndB with AHSA1/START domain